MNYKNFDELPIMLTIKELGDILGVCRVKAYELTHQNNFPIITIGRRRLIPKEGLIRWIERNGGIN